MFALLSLTFSMLVCLIMLEVVLRIAVPQHEIPKWLVPSEDYGHFQRPNFQQVYSYRGTNVTWTARINNLGLRGDDIDLARRDDRRIVFVGDSFTFGYGLDEPFIFPTLTGEILNHTLKEPWTVINTGVGGWGTLQQLKFVSARLAEFRPDIIVLTFCDNDLQDDVIFERGKAGGLLPSFPGKQWLRDHSRLYPIVYAIMSQRLFSRAISAEDQQKEIRPQKELGGPVDQSNPGGPDLIVAWAQYWPRTLEAIRSFHNAALSQNPDVIMIVQQAQPLRADIFAMLRTLDNGDSLRYIHLGLDVEKWEDRNVLLPYDPHWHEVMHQLSARRISELILSYLAGRAKDTPDEQ